MKLLSIFKKKPKINEFEELKNLIYCAISDMKKDDITILRDDSEIAVGRFASYDVFLPINHVYPRDLDFKKYTLSSVSKYTSGLRLHYLSDYTRNQTTRSLENE